jgi:hypothetical protein
MTELIAMLTLDDQTVSNARAVFAEALAAPTSHWGFKEGGIPVNERRALAQDMKAAGMTVYYESLQEDEHECLMAAQLAADEEVDCLLGMRYFASVATMLESAGVSYVPTCGVREGIPRMLHGTVDCIVEEALAVRPMVSGIALSLYRWSNPDYGALGRAFIDSVSAPVIITGSINSFARLDEIATLAPWAVTVGSALFKKDFGDLSFGDGLARIRRYLDVEAVHAVYADDVVI